MRNITYSYKLKLQSLPKWKGLITFTLQILNVKWSKEIKVSKDSKKYVGYNKIELHVQACC